MAVGIPLVRASAVTPAEHWFRTQGIEPGPILRQFGLPARPSACPERAVSFHALFSLLDRMSDRHGPDFGCRIATPETLMMLGAPAAAIRASRTPREVLHKLTRVFHRHVSHVFLLVEAADGGLVLKESMPVSGCDTGFHAGQQHVAALVACMGRLIDGKPLKAHVQLVPHPEHGLAHLVPWLGPDIEGGKARQLSIFIPDEALDLQFPWEPAPMVAELLPRADRLARESLRESALLLIDGMLDDCEPSLDLLAMMADRSRRSLQRLLEKEGTSYAELLDNVRQRRVLAELTSGDCGVAAIASNMGYRSPSSLTRAVRRWTDASPRQVRRSGQDK